MEKEKDVGLEGHIDDKIDDDSENGQDEDEENKDDDEEDHTDDKGDDLGDDTDDEPKDGSGGSSYDSNDDGDDDASPVIGRTVMIPPTDLYCRSKDAKTWVPRASDDDKREASLDVAPVVPSRTEHGTQTEAETLDIDKFLRLLTRTVEALQKQHQHYNEQRIEDAEIMTRLSGQMSFINKKLTFLVKDSQKERPSTSHAPQPVDLGRQIELLEKVAKEQHAQTVDTASDNISAMANYQLQILKYVMDLTVKVNSLLKPSDPPTDAKKGGKRHRKDDDDEVDHQGRSKEP
ncbi:PREDICTED: YTH domain-containing protein 1-like [Ipomoea nil]|uniref:YTH domain-containing protein 1-like n=1 Tax=Ipomoea nil TaxID=35883 RepID=UPI000900DDEC|nr:PREDICTED: YTH domain-containing protein 1-like [Ipomoea nil]